MGEGVIWGSGMLLCAHSTCRRWMLYVEVACYTMDVVLHVGLVCILWDGHHTCGSDMLHMGTV